MQSTRTLLPAPLPGLRPSVLAALLLMAAAPHAAQAQATSAARAYDIPAQALGATLTRIGQESGASISIDSELVRGLPAPAIQGRYTTEQAARQALASSGLQLARTGNGTLTVKRAEAGSVGHASVLSEVTVSGKAPGSTTEGTGSYTTFSTSSSTRLNLTPQETPQSVSVITRQRMDDQRMSSLSDALDAAVGITVKPFSLGSDSPQMWARGSSITNFQIDGVPVAASMSNYLQSTAIYDRVEIVKGATGIMSGLGTPAATINMVRKRPTQERQTSVTLEAGNWSRGGAGLDTSIPLNADASARGRLVADFKRDGAWTRNYQQDYGVLYAIGELDLGPRTLLTGGFSHITRDTTAPIRAFYNVYSNGAPTGAGLEDGASPDWSYYDHQVNNVFGSIEHRFGSGWSAKAELTHGRYQYETYMASPVGSVNQATGLGASAHMIHWASHTQQTSLDAYATGPFSWFGRRHELIGGVTLSSLEQQSPGYPAPRVGLGNVFHWTNEVAKPTAAATGESNTKEYQYSAYLNSRLELGDKTSLLLGSRFINWKQNRDSLSYSSGVVTPTRLQESGIFVPYVGLVHALNDTYSLYASYTKIFNPQPDYVIDIDGKRLAPEEGISYEAGIKGSFRGGALTSSLALFRTQQNTFPVWDGATRTYTAIDDTITQGVEVELAGELARGWQLATGYTFSKTVDKDDVRLMTRIPLHTFKLSTTYRLPGDWSQLTLGGGIHWESKTGDPFEQYTQPGYALLNLMARYEVNQQLTLAAYLNNVFDKRYMMGVSDTRGLYGAPRNFMLSAKYRF